MNALPARPFIPSRKYITFTKENAKAEIFIGSKYDDLVGYFIEPTVILAREPNYRTMVAEIFGPVLTVYVYADEEFEQTLELCDQSSLYALTGSIFATDRAAISLALARLEHSAGNFYINDKPTGAVVGQQPFGGGRASGTNDKAVPIPTSCAGYHPGPSKRHSLPRPLSTTPLWMKNR